MSREGENVLKKINEFMEQNVDENMTKEEADELIQTFISQYNDNIPDMVTEKTARTSDDYYELAEMAEDNAQALKYAKKAVRLDPDNIDAKVMVAEITIADPVDMLKKYEELMTQGRELMDKKGFAKEECIGDYWQIIETRPFMRLCNNYMELLIDCGMMRKAIAEGQEMIRLNESDNIGIRYVLAHLYAYLEDEQGALALHEQYEKSEETQMLLPLSVLYYKLGKFDKAEEYLLALAKINKDTKKFVRGVVNDSLDKYISQMNQMGYQPFSIEEFMIEMMENTFLFEAASSYFYWAEKILKKKK